MSALRNIIDQLVNLKKPDQDAFRDYFNSLLEKAQAMKGCIRLGTCKIWADSWDEPSNELTLTADIRGNLAKDSAFESLSQEDQFRALENAISSICTYLEDQEDPNLKALACAELQLLGVEFIPIRNRLSDNGAPNSIFDNAQESFARVSREILGGMHPVCHALLTSVTVPWDAVFCESELHYEIAFAFSDQCPADRVDIKTLETIACALTEEHSDHDKVKDCVSLCAKKAIITGNIHDLETLDIEKNRSETGFTFNPEGFCLEIVSESGNSVATIPMNEQKLNLTRISYVNLSSIEDEDLNSFRIFCTQLANSDINELLKLKVPGNHEVLSAIIENKDLKSRISCLCVNLDDLEMEGNAVTSFLCSESVTYALVETAPEGLEIDDCDLCIKGDALEKFYSKEFKLFSEG